MKAHSLVRNFLTGLAFASFSLGATAAQNFSKLYIFGDSLSDNGNLASVTAPFPNPPFFGNRVTNGKVAVEDLADQLGLTANPALYLTGPEQGTNYAVAGAKASTNDPIDLNTQVNAFLLNHGGAAATDNLYLMFIGGNDVRAARDEPDLLKSLKILSNAAAAEEANIRKLIGAGARSLMVVNVPDIGSIPETSGLALQKNDPFLPIMASIKTSLYNADLARRVSRIEHDTGTDIVVFDLFGLLGNIIHDAKAYAYTNTTEPCFSEASHSYTAGCQYGANIDHYLFFDEIHPTAITHLRASRALFAAVPAVQ